MENCLNFNVGILGHVDSGKTSLAKVLSSIASTAAFDKNPQSQERGITIDLGFSSFCIDAPDHILTLGYKKLQFTLVDCPGHASLIRTIIGGAKIIDAMLLVIDINKGIQTQTAECLVIGEIFCKNLIVVLNKIDLISTEKQKETIHKISKKLSNTLKNTKFADSKIISVSAKSSSETLGIEELVNSMKNFCYLPERQLDKPFVFSLDHCFGIKGQGTVMTGTILQGSVCVNDNIEIPILKITKKVKSIQMFRYPVEKANQGDRVGICVTQFDPKLLERSLVASIGYINLVHGFIAHVKKIEYYKHSINSKAKFHISLGHETIIAKCTFFGIDKDIDKEKFDFENEYLFQSELMQENQDTNDKISKHQFALVEFEKIVPLMPNSNFIASKLDMDIHTNMCRLAFWGKISIPLLDNYKNDILTNLKVYKNKCKEGIVERMNNESELIVKSLLKKGTNISIFNGLKVNLSTGENAYIDGYFGQSGKVKIRINGSLKEDTKQNLQSINQSRKKGKKTQDMTKTSDITTEQIKIILKFKKYIFDEKKKIVQT